MSKEKQFTPGPWEVSQDNGWKCGVLTSDEHFFIECETVSDKNEACFENDANARLIAAAPEMYELLKELIRVEGCANGVYKVEALAKDLLNKIHNNG